MVISCFQSLCWKLLPSLTENEAQEVKWITQEQSRASKFMHYRSTLTLPSHSVTHANCYMLVLEELEGKPDQRARFKSELRITLVPLFVSMQPTQKILEPPCTTGGSSKSSSLSSVCSNTHSSPRDGKSKNGWVAHMLRVMQTPAIMAANAGFLQSQDLEWLDSMTLLKLLLSSWQR